jgi:hypothetical protein
VIIFVVGFILLRAYLRSRVAVKHALGDIFHEMKNFTVAELLELSRGAENQRIAVRYKYIAAILSLNERGIITIEPSATNAIILRQIKKSAPEIFADFSQIVDAFHLSWFGHKNLSENFFEKINFSVEAVMRHA